MDGTIIDELAVQRVLARYCHLVDDGRLDELVALFTDDGELRFARHEATGRAELRAWLEEHHPPEARGKHLTTNVVVEVEGDHATATSDFAFVAFVERQLTVVLTGRYEDALVRGPDGWRIARRTVRALRPPR